MGEKFTSSTELGCGRERKRKEEREVGEVPGAWGEGRYPRGAVAAEIS